MSYEVKLETFEGPLDLLYHLIEKNEIDIYNIPISEVTDQYIQYLDNLQKFDMEMASEFLVMAATLLEIKSRMLLPNPIEEQIEFDVQGVDPRRDLVLKLIEYKKYKIIADYFKQREELYGRVHFKEQDNIEDFINKIDYKESDITLDIDVLISSVQRVLKKLKRLDENRKSFFQELKRDIYTVEEKVELLKKKVQSKTIVSFNKLFSQDSCKLEVIVTFLALLELLKLKEIEIKQDYIFGDILIYQSQKN